MPEYTATYSPDDNKLRLYARSRLDAETYAKAKRLGFKWAPKQELFVAPMWTPSREDFLLELVDEIEDEDKSLVDRATERADRFEGYSANRAKDAERARQAVHAIADHIPLGQPILVGHHSERRARRDQEKIQNGMHKAVKMWRQSEYWEQRAAGALRAAEYKEAPAVRARRIRNLEADKRKRERDKSEAERKLRNWQQVAGMEGETQHKFAIELANYDYFNITFADGTSNSAWSSLTSGKITAADVAAQAVKLYQNSIPHHERWLEHYNNRLKYERAMLQEQGGTASDQKKLEKGGAVQCVWAPSRGGWAYIVKVNQVTVSVYHVWNSGGGRKHRVNVDLTKITNVMTAAEVQQARQDGRMVEAECGVGFYLTDQPLERRPVQQPKPEAQPFEQMQQALKEGVKVVAVDQLFPTPKPIVMQMLEAAAIEPDHLVLEPSAGNGAIAEELFKITKRVDLVEINSGLAAHLRGREWPCQEGDFLELELVPEYDRIVMNPPFKNASDILHIRRAAQLLKPGGRLVALCAAGPRQKLMLERMGCTWEQLPPGSFVEQGTGVNVAMVTWEKPLI